MKIEKMRKNHKREIVMGVVITFCLISTITFVVTRSKYQVTQNIKLVNGTVNYKVPDVRTVAVYLNDGNGDVETNNIPTSGYNLNSDKSVCKVYNGTTSIEETPKDNNITIEYNNGKINILGVSKKNTRCYLYFDKKNEPTSEDTLAKLGITNVKETTPDFSQVATTDEGVYSASDGMYGGTSYYWRGASLTNHVIFANKCWRIVRINGDGSIRLIYNGAVSSGTCAGNGSNAGSIAVNGVKYFNSAVNNSSYVGWTYTVDSQRPVNNATATASNAKIQTDSWFNSNIIGTDLEKIATGKFCNDRNVASGYTWEAITTSPYYYAGYKRLYSDYQPTLSCPSGDVYELKAGAIIADEVEFAGGANGKNTTYYLYTGFSYWTMTPYNWSHYNGYPCLFFINPNGWLYYGASYSGVYPSLRPVINLKANVTFAAGGTGTQNNPYVVQ